MLQLEPAIGRSGGVTNIQTVTNKDGTPERVGDYTLTYGTTTFIRKVKVNSKGNPTGDLKGRKWKVKK